MLPRPSALTSLYSSKLSGGTQSRWLDPIWQSIEARGETAAEQIAVYLHNRIRFTESSQRSILRHACRRVWLVSIGTGEPALTVQPSDGGVYGWFNSGNLLSVLMDGPMQITDGVAGMMLDGTGYTYARIQPPLTGPGYSCSPALDDYTADNLANLVLAGKAAVGSDAFARARESLAARRAARARR